MVLEAKGTFFKSVDFRAVWSLSQNKFVSKFSCQGNLYLARYRRLKFRLQGKFCRKITTKDGSNCNCGLQKQSLQYAKLTVCGLQSRLRILSQVTDSLLNTPYSCSFKWKTSNYVSLMKENCISAIEGHWNLYFLYEDGATQFSLRDIDNTSHCVHLSNTTSSYRSPKSQSCSLKNTTQYAWMSVGVSFHHKMQRFFGTSWKHSDICNTNEQICQHCAPFHRLPRKGVIVLCWHFWLVSQENRPSL